ncbi:hypothetical protein IMCC3317_27460 [Kordia antarctica]|uniref:Uncharacterized protein n=1 Tax=Kordia antarctica TaxID=1218801 RepID=A0A7L4ZLJ9_9FLAO|nr:hypothetical protein [Kordia antarctica]QHI37367.1 hypothetical protein IMCC3317_27460 [Kordia antarctica]
MTEYKGCKEMTVDEFLTMVENSPELKKKFEQLGLSQDEEGLKVVLNYYELLTKEELEFLKNVFKDFYPGSGDENASFFVKFNSDPNALTFCVSNVICDSCHKHLLNSRKHKDHLTSNTFGAGD